MSIKPLFTATASCTGGRNGHSEASDHSVSVNLSVPKEMGGPGKPGTTTPEHLFAAGYAACFQSALAVVGRRQHVDTSDSTVEADVTIGTVPGGGYGLAVALRISIPGTDAETTRTLAEAAHQVCPYSNATRGNIDVTVSAA